MVTTRLRKCSAQLDRWADIFAFQSWAQAENGSYPLSLCFVLLSSFLRGLLPPRVQLHQGCRAGERGLGSHLRNSLDERASRVASLKDVRIDFQPMAPSVQV
jgi:hypothetical protein